VGGGGVVRGEGVWGRRGVVGGVGGGGGGGWGVGGGGVGGGGGGGGFLRHTPCVRRDRIMIRPTRKKKVCRDGLT